MNQTQPVNWFTVTTGLFGLLLFLYRGIISFPSDWKVILFLSIFTILLYLWEIRLPGGHLLSFISIGFLSSLFIYGINAASWVVFFTVLFSLFRRKGEFIKVFFNFGVFIFMINATYLTYLLLTGHNFPVLFDDYLAIIISLLAYSIVNISWIYFYHIISYQRDPRQVFREITSSLSTFFVTVLPALVFSITLAYQPVLGSISLLIIIGLIHHNFNKYYSLFDKYEQVSMMASTDEVTGLYNHRYFQEQLHRLMNDEITSDMPISIIFIDIDYFKKYNDTFGHPAGDKLLKDMAVILKESFRSTDIVARYGGEEFVVIACDVDERAAFRISERVRARVESYPFFGADKQPHGRLTISCGIATYPHHTRDREELIEFADQALYQAKSLGKNRVCIFGESGLEPQQSVR